MTHKSNLKNDGDKIDKLTLDEAGQNIAFNEKRSKKYPAIYEEFYDELMYSNPNDYDEMKRLYDFYGYQYSPSLWALNQLAFVEANKKTEERLKNDKLHK